MHIEFLLEEPSAEAFLSDFVPKIAPAGTTCNFIRFQGKSDLLANLTNRLKGYRDWLPEDWRIVVLIDEDRQDCVKLKEALDSAAGAAGLKTKSKAGTGAFVVLNRIAVEELEAWFLGDVEALREAYPGVPAGLGSRANFRDPDAVAGGTWEALERVLQRAGHFPGGIGKIELARTMAQHLEPGRNRSRSFRCFVDGIAALSPASR
ncbi:MAG: DUF4276 family protein [Verrucomicrobiaceae bacterium]|nr:DUF4276 family protein [Verrucomicrobiaceae bacterium]